MEANFNLLFALALLWVVGVVAVSILFRISRDKPIFPSVPEGALYAERWGSGRNRSSLWSSIGGASNCLIIAITSDKLMIAPRFPLNLGFVAEAYGLELDIPLDEIAQVERKRALWRHIALITFRDGRRFELYPRRIDDFMAALGRRWS